MLFKEMMQTEREKGRTEELKECILEILEMYGTIPEDIAAKIDQENDPKILRHWHITAARATSFEDFRDKM